MKMAFREPPKWKDETRLLLGKIVAIVEKYRKAGYRMTLRQLYYQLVAAVVFANQQRNYARLSDLLGQARMCGVVDWDFIEDRIRAPRFPNEFEGMADGIDTLTNAYRLDRWAGQRRYVEVWVEKDALSGVLAPVTTELHVRLMVNRGYSSITAMHDASVRFRRAEQLGKECHVLYFGDHDPSGEDMVRDVDDRLRELWAQVEVRKVALTMDQVREHALPPNPAKMSDSRAAAYVEEHGDESWELDALPPDVLDGLVREFIGGLLDRDLFDEIVGIEGEHKAELGELKGGQGAELDKEWAAWRKEHPVEGGEDSDEEDKGEDQGEEGS